MEPCLGAPDPQVLCLRGALRTRTPSIWWLLRFQQVVCEFTGRRRKHRGLNTGAVLPTVQLNGHTELQGNLGNVLLLRRQKK